MTSKRDSMLSVVSVAHKMTDLLGDYFLLSITLRFFREVSVCSRHVARHTALLITRVQGSVESSNENSLLGHGQKLPGKISYSSLFTLEVEQ